MTTIFSYLKQKKYYFNFSVLTIYSSNFTHSSMHINKKKKRLNFVYFTLIILRIGTGRRGKKDSFTRNARTCQAIVRSSGILIKYAPHFSGDEF